jgi:guanylate kinase
MFSQNFTHLASPFYKRISNPLIISGPSYIGKKYLLNYLILNFNCQQINPLIDNTYSPSRIHKTDFNISKVIQSNKNPVTILPAHLISSFKFKYPLSRAIYLLPDSIELLEKRMKKQNLNPIQIETNLTNTLEEILYYNEYLKSLFDETFTVTQGNFEYIVDNIVEKYLVNN